MAKRGRPPGRKRFSLKRAKASSDRAIARYMRQRKAKKSHKRYVGVAAKHNRGTARRSGKRGLRKGHTKSAAWRKAIGAGVKRAHARGAYKNRRRGTRRRRRAA